MYSTYEEASEATVSREQARREIEDHGADWSEYLDEVGDRPEYQGREVLDWLGY